ncbi:MAG: UPF0147 family protein [Candidatus Marsarchaeota archaeon]|nr:UPF0147 family protein [Candidatus Marsarchaeota archaeon]
MGSDKQAADAIVQINVQMDSLIGDTSVPKNVRGAVTDAKAKLNESGDVIVRVSAAIYSLDAVSNDINLPAQARTVIWSILSTLESIKQ